jgi:type I restriction enzyme S subunit
VKALEQENLRLTWELAGGSTPEHWEFKTIESLLENPKAISVGVMYPGEDTIDGVPLIKVSDVKNGKVTKCPTFCISPEVDEEHKRTRLNGTELLITLVGEPGDCVIVKADMRGWNAARAIAVVRLADINQRTWLRYVLLSRSAKHLIKTRLNTTVQKTLNLKDIKELGVPIPPLPEQKAIADILSSFDEKIELLREQNKTLESLAQTIFKEWFVNFNYPDATGEMVDSELGEIPKGWRIGKLAEVTNIKGGGTPSTKNEEFWNGDIHWTSPKDLSISKSTFLLDTEKKVTKAGLRKISSGLLPKGTLLLSSRAPIGYLAISNVDISINQGYIALLDDAYFPNYFMFLWLKKNMRLITNAANGSTFLEISKTAFKNIECIIPDRDTLYTFQEAIAPTFDKILLNIKQAQTLSKTRDALLPKLMGGTIRLKEVALCG